MGERRASGPEASLPGLRQAGEADLDRLLGTIRRRRLVQQARERAALGSNPVALAPVAGSRVAGSSPSLARGAAVPVPGRVQALEAKASSGTSAEGGTVLEVQAAGPAVTILRVARPPGFRFQAGQAIKLGLSGAGVRRSYSIASAPHEPHLELCIERVPGGRLSALLADVSAGARLELAPSPKGKLTLQGKGRHLMVATVTGIAPLRSMLRDALSKPGASNEFWILHGASHADELPYAAELGALAQSDPRVHYLPTVSRPGDLKNRGWPGRVGRVESHVLTTLQALGTPKDVAVYACGHPEMVGNVQSLLAPMGYDVSAEDFG